MTAKAFQKAHEGFEGQRRQYEGDPETERIDSKQADALVYRILSCCDRENGGEYRPDARRPAKCESQSDEIGAKQPSRCRRGLAAHFLVKQWNFEDAEKMEADDDNRNAGDLGEQREVFCNQLPDKRRRCAERHENGRETEHECDRGEHHAHMRTLGQFAFTAQLLERRTAKKAKVRWDERQDAGRKEADQPGNQRAYVSDFHHWVIIPAFRNLCWQYTRTCRGLFFQSINKTITIAPEIRGPCDDWA